jgi:hypothetical protein
MRKFTIVQVIVDKAILVLCAALVFGGVMVVIFVSKSYLSLDDEWLRLVLSSLSFVVVFLYTALTVPILRVYRKDMLFLPLLLGFGLIPVLLVFTLFVLRLVPMPRHLVPYLLATLVLVPGLIMGLRSVLRICRRM